MEPLLIVYDADCGVCQASVAWLRRHDRRERLRFLGNDAPDLPAGVSREESERTMIAVDGPHRWTRGAALSRILRELGPSWAALGWLLRIPGIARLADWGYDRFARNRHRVAAALGMRACAAGPGPDARKPTS